MTGETYLYRDDVRGLLEGAEFQSGFITEVSMDEILAQHDHLLK